VPCFQGHFIVGAGLVVSPETSLAEAEGADWREAPRFTATLPRATWPGRRPHGIAWTCVEDHFPEPPGLDALAPLLGQDGEVSQGEVAVDALVDAAELVGAGEKVTATKLTKLGYLGKKP